MILDCLTAWAAYVSRLFVYKAIIVLAVSVGTAMAAPLKVVALGDSLTHGFGLAPDSGFVPQLEVWLRDRGHDVIVINMGVSGDTTEGGRARLDWAIADGADAVIVELGGNDLLRGIDPARSRDNLDTIVGTLAERGIPSLVAGMTAPLNYGPEFKTAFDEMYGVVAETHGAIHYPQFLAGLVSESGPRADLMQSDGIHPNADGVLLIVRAIGPSVEVLLDRAQKE